MLLRATDENQSFIDAGALPGGMGWHMRLVMNITGSTKRARNAPTCCYVCAARYCAHGTIARRPVNR